MEKETDPRIIKMVELYAREPSLWMTTHSQYHDKRRRREHIKEIAAQLPGVSATEVDSKIRNLRSYYTKEIRKERKAQSEGGEVYVSRWIYFKMLDFLEPYVIGRKATCETSRRWESAADPPSEESRPPVTPRRWEGADPPSEDTRPTTDIYQPAVTDAFQAPVKLEGSVEPWEESDKPSESDDDTSQYTIGNELDIIPEIQTPYPTLPHTPTSEKKRKASSCLRERKRTRILESELLHTAIRTLTKFCEGSSSAVKDKQKEQVEDEDLIFAKYIATELKHISSFREKQKVKLKIQSIIFDAQFEQPSS